MNNYKKHQELVKKVLLALQKKFPDGRFFEAHVGMFLTMHSGTPVRVNRPGMSDIWGLVNGTYFSIEVKTGKGVQNKDQKNWEKTVNDIGGKYYLIRSVEDVDKIES